MNNETTTPEIVPEVLPESPPEIMHEIMPEILEAEWDDGQMMALFDDLNRGAEVSHVQVRSSASVGPRDKQVTLSEARDLFSNREATAIQIQYSFDGQAWCDTLMVGEHTTKIIRTRQQFQNQ